MIKISSIPKSPQYRSSLGRRGIVLSPLLLLIFLCAGCSEYWWTRGQPPANDTLLKRSGERLETALSMRGEYRPELAPLARSIRSNLELVRSSLGQAARSTEQAPEGSNAGGMQALEKDFISLESKLSAGSRPAYAELAGQLRAFTSQLTSNDGLNENGFNLFSARVQFFLASELDVPPTSL